MSTLTCYDASGNAIQKLHQWDIDRSIVISGIEILESPSFHFCNRRHDKALVVPAKVSNGVLSAPVPNILLQDPESLVIHVYQEFPQDGRRTTDTVWIPVEPRQRPDDYIYQENIEYLNWVKREQEAIALIEELDGAEERISTSVYQSVMDSMEPDATLSVAKKPADAAAVGTALKEKAPAGFGLGTAAKYVSDLNTCLLNGWYYVHQVTKNVPAGFDFGSVFVHNRKIGEAPDQVVQCLFSHFTSNTYGTPTARCQMIRHTTDGGNNWVEEWVNPPMQLNVEYRTTERRNGLTVYTQLVHFGGLPESGRKSVQFVQSAGFAYPISLQAFIRTYSSPGVTQWQDLNNLDIVNVKPYISAKSVVLGVSQAINVDNDVYILIKYSKA